MRFVRGVMVVCGIAAASPSLAAQPAAKPDLSKAEQIVAKVCAACHGADGNSVIAGNPVLAGQHPEYLTKQLANYKSGERKSPVMSPMAAPLSPEDIKNLGAYFAAQKPKPGAAKDIALVKTGQEIYRGGILDKAVPACASCHLPNGAGVPVQYPRLAGQHAEYSLQQLQHFRSGERANDPNKMMRAIAARMTEQEMRAAAEYISGLR
jgi:cytochrome c553